MAFCKCNRMFDGLKELRVHQLECRIFQTRGVKAHRLELALNELYSFLDKGLTFEELSRAIIQWRETWGDLRTKPRLRRRFRGE